MIAQEAGCFVSGSSLSPHDGTVGEKILAGRKYVVIRSACSTFLSNLIKINLRAINGADGFGQQVSLVKDFYKSVTEWDAI